MENHTAKLTPNRFIKTLSIVHFGLMMGPVLFGFFAYFQSQDAFLDYSDTTDVFLIVVPVLAFAGVFAGNLLFNQIMKSTSEANGLRLKLTRFQTASLIKYALIEGPAFIGVAAFFITQNLTYLYISAVLILYLYLLRPTKDKIVNGIALKGEERAQFNRADEPLP